MTKYDHYHHPRGWWCSRWPGHTGSCALRPRWWNLRGRFR